MEKPKFGFYSHTTKTFITFEKEEDFKRLMLQILDNEKRKNEIELKEKFEK